MSGLHEKAVELVQRCIAEFEGHGGQFTMIEYTFEDFGKELMLAFDTKKSAPTLWIRENIHCCRKKKEVATEVA